MSPKERLFYHEYLVDLNATQAAIRAGYSEKSAAVLAARLLRKVHIRDAIELEMQKREKRTDITADKVIKELAKIAFSDPRKLFNSQGKLQPITDLDENTASIISSIESVTVGNAEYGIGEITKIKLWDKIRALELLGKHLKLFSDRIEIEVNEKPKSLGDFYGNVIDGEASADT